jgi:hypothetical protein
MFAPELMSTGVTVRLATVGAVPVADEVTLNVRELLVPAGVVTVTEREPVVAVEDITTLHVTWVAVDWMPDVVIPVLELKFTAVAPLRFEPEMTRFTVAPCLPLEGLREEIAGAVVVAVFTLNARELLVPPGLVTVTVREPVVALDEIITLQVT